jgi:muramoyltetrapeptide carboxypeptidase
LGDTVGIVAPASGFDEAKLEVGIAKLESLGYRVRLGQHIHQRAQQYFAGTPQQRADDLHAMFADPEVRAIVCARGGYGSQALLPLLDLGLVRANPKPIVGCSDVTALQLWLYEQCGLVSWHGPMVAGDFAREDGMDMQSWTSCARGMAPWQLASDSGLQVVRAGRATGKLWGGCLSLLVSTLATPFELLRDPQEDWILFLEDIGEKPYKIERMFRQWHDAGKLKRVKGIIFGEMLECEQPNARYSLRDVLHRVLEDFPGPVACGLRSGHVSRANITLPIGVSVELVCEDAATLVSQEAATLPA